MVNLYSAAEAKKTARGALYTIASQIMQKIHPCSKPVNQLIS